MNAGERLPGTPAPMHMWTTPQGLRIAADTWGDPNGPLVVLLHGGGQTRHAWRSTARKLGAAGYHAVAYDLRGHGDSDWSPDGDYAQETFARDLQAVIHVLGDRKSVLVGASLGAATALTAVGQGLVDAAALIMVDFVASTEPEGFERVKAFMLSGPEGFASLEDVADAITAFRGGVERPANLSGLAKVVRRGPDGRFRWHWDQRQIDWRVKEYPRRHLALSDCARKVRVPLLLLRGGSSDVVSEEGAREFLQLVPHADYVNIEGAGHMIAGDRNDTFGQAASPFLARVAPVPAPASQAVG
ncbi:MAG TPA: alpha/beta hydrolase [Ramlibacter sp.]|nr:alpha/beta hydrolase [Ramlibacter sp.]